MSARNSSRTQRSRRQRNTKPGSHFFRSRRLRLEHLEDRRLLVTNTLDVSNPSERYGLLPLTFEPNVGQTAAEVDFLSRGSGYTLFLTNQEAVLSLDSLGADPEDT